MAAVLEGGTACRILTPTCLHRRLVRNRPGAGRESGASKKKKKIRRAYRTAHTNRAARRKVLRTTGSENYNGWVRIYRR